MNFDFSPTKKGDTNLSSEVVVFADSTWVTRWNNQNYRKTADQITAGKTEPNRWWLFDLTELTDEAKEDMDAMMHAPIDPEGRSFSNIYRCIQEDGISELYDESKFSAFFSSFKPFIKRETERFKKSV